jgi:hypothetical protein
MASRFFTPREWSCRNRKTENCVTENSIVENSPAIYGGENPADNSKSRQGRQNISFVPDGTCLVCWMLYPAINGWDIFRNRAIVANPQRGENGAVAFPLHIQRMK